jgi:hypothetical protein
LMDVSFAAHHRNLIAKKWRWASSLKNRHDAHEISLFDTHITMYGLLRVLDIHTTKAKHLATTLQLPYVGEATVLL